jgi:hypothetical protein
MDRPTPPWIRIASANIDVDRNQVIEFFPSRLGFQALYPREVPVRRKAGVGDPSSMPEVASWVVNFGPTLLRQIAVWSLVVYGGKKLIDGMVTEAGKDLWKGLKAFVEFVYQKVKDKRTVLRTPAACFIDIVSDNTNHPGGVWIRIALPGRIDDLEQIVSQLEKRLFVPTRERRITPDSQRYGAGGRTRTDTRSEPRQILSLVRIPISPLRREGLTSYGPFSRIARMAQNPTKRPPANASHPAV